MVRRAPTAIGTAKARTKGRPGPCRSGSSPPRALRALVQRLMPSASSPPAIHVPSHACVVDWREAIQAAAIAVTPAAIRPKPEMAVNAEARSIVWRMKRRSATARPWMGTGSLRSSGRLGCARTKTMRPRRLRRRQVLFAAKLSRWSRPRATFVTPHPTFLPAPMSQECERRNRNPTRSRLVGRGAGRWTQSPLESRMPKPHVSRPDRAPLARSVLVPSLAAVLLFATGAGPSIPSTSSAERYTVPGSSIALYDLVGEVTVEAASGGDATVEVTRRGPDAAKLRVERGPIGGIQTLRVVFPADRVVYRGLGRWSSDQIQVGDDGRFSDS